MRLAGTATGDRWLTVQLYEAPPRAGESARGRHSCGRLIARFRRLRASQSDRQNA
jgi:hypothetical protein